MVYWYMSLFYGAENQEQMEMIFWVTRYGTTYNRQATNGLLLRYYIMMTSCGTECQGHL